MYPIDPFVAILVAGSATAVIAGSCGIARNLGGSAAFGLLGPVGWIIAALQGIRDALRASHEPPRD